MIRPRPRRFYYAKTVMIFQRFFDEGLAQSSYLVACSRTHRAAVIDPRRDVDVYAAALRQRGLTLEAVIETHIHADFVSGARELTARGAIVVAGPGAQLQFPHHEARDGEQLHVGDLVFEALHTPGHTPEHISILVRDPDGPARLLTGDTLFVGSVGRPDLLGSDVMRRLAGELYDTLFGKLLMLGDEVEVHPGHGAGSLCGSGIGKQPSSTIGDERRYNPMLQHDTRDAFAAAVLRDLPDTPPYFAVMKRLNQQGPEVLALSDGVRPPAAISPAYAAEAMRNGAMVLDVRSAQAFGAGHPAGAINVAFGAKVGYWAGWVIPNGTPIVLLTEGREDAAVEVKRQLLRVGFDDLVGCIGGGFDAWSRARLPIGTLTQMSAAELYEAVTRTRLTVVDVRTRGEWDAGHIDGALHIPLGQLARRADEIPKDATVATICEGGLRSSLAASLLARSGRQRIVNVFDGMSEWRKAQRT